MASDAMLSRVSFKLEIIVVGTVARVITKKGPAVQRQIPVERRDSKEVYETKISASSTNTDSSMPRNKHN